MGFLDNLESSLSSLESREEKDPAAEYKRRQDDLASTIAAAPWAEKLRNSDFTKKLCDQATLSGHRMRTKVYLAWLDKNLRLEARQRYLVLRPTGSGIIAEFVAPDGDLQTEPVNLSSDPQALIDRWLGLSAGSAAKQEQ